MRIKAAHRAHRMSTSQLSVTYGDLGEPIARLLEITPRQQDDKSVCLGRLCISDLLLGDSLIRPHPIYKNPMVYRDNCGELLFRHFWSPLARSEVPNPIGHRFPDLGARIFLNEVHAGNGDFGLVRPGPAEIARWPGEDNARLGVNE
jgi:hypothetical protein